tara:strand:+ start:138 stop:371 length:234 start_codon:yes stop_codon:yes gene_type:complete
LNLRPLTPHDNTADNDAQSDVNIGVQKAKEAAQLVKGSYIVPRFDSEYPHYSDFNDFAMAYGKDALRLELMRYKYGK